MINLKKDKFQIESNYLTSFVDILFILIVFFILTMGIGFQSLEVEIPSVDEENFGESQSNNNLLEIKKSSFLLNKKPISNFDKLKISILELIERDSKQEFIVATHKDTLAQKLVEVLSYFKDKKIKMARILVKKNDKK